MKKRIISIVVVLAIAGIALFQLVPIFAGDPIDVSIVTTESLKTDLLKTAPYDKWTKEDWLKNQADRDIENLPYERLQELVKYYPEKINRLQSIYNETKDLNTIDEIARLKDKFITVTKEIEYRDTGVVTDRLIHHTVYYIDLNAGNDGNTGLSTAQAWRTIEKYTTTTVRTAGDIAWVRANTTEIPAGDIVFDEDGTSAALIEIRGCSSAAGEDPWGDASSVKPIINFNSTTNSLILNGDDFWRLYRLDVRNSAVSNGMIKVQYQGGMVFFDYLDVSGAGHASTAYGVQVEGPITITNSTFASNKHRSIYVTRRAIIRNCTFNGGAGTTDYGVLVIGGHAWVSNSTFGVTTTHDTASLYALQGGILYSYNNLFADATELVAGADGIIYSEDHDQVLGTHKIESGAGTSERDSTIQLDGYDSVKLTPSSSCAAYLPLTVASQERIGGYQLWVPAAATTITIKARETAAWAADPTNTEFYFEASYISAAAGAPTRSTVVSTEALSGTAEVSFTMTFTPARAGFVYITVYLKKYEAGKSVNVSVVPQ